MFTVNLLTLRSKPSFLKLMAKIDYCLDVALTSCGTYDTWTNISPKPPNSEKC